MEDNPSRLRWRTRFTLGSMMMAIAGLAGIFTLARPLAKPATVRAAEAVLKRFGPPGLDAHQYRAESVRKTPSGYWQVEFARVSGSGAPRQTAVVSDELVNACRFNPWYSVPK
jgi:hypothetical protein